MSRRPLFLSIALLLSAAGLACDAQETSPALYVEYGDCATVLTGPRCVLPPSRELRLWVRADPGTPINFDDTATTVRVIHRQDIDGGTHFRLAMPDDSSLLRVRATVAGASAEWRMHFAQDKEAPELAQVRELFNGRRYADAEALILSLLDDPAFTQLGRAHRLAGIFYHNRGAPEKARTHYRVSIERNLAEGRWLDALKGASALSYLLQQTFRDFTGAREIYAGFVASADAPAEARYFENYDRGLLGFNTGDARTALRHLSAAATHARRMGSTGRWLQRHLDAEELLAAQLQSLGRRDEAETYYRSWKQRELTSLAPCERAMFKGNIGWSALLRLEAGDLAPDPTPILDEALAAMRDHCSNDDIVAGYINLALSHVHAGRFGAAAVALDNARATTRTPALRLRFWELDIAARLALHDGQPEVAMATLAAMELLADATLSPDARWRAAARRGLVLEHLGRNDDALAAYAAADERLARDLTSVPFYAGRGPFAATRDWVTRRRLTLLHERGDDDAVARLIRSAQRRSFRDLDDGSSARNTQAAAGYDDALAEYARIRQALDDELASGWRVPGDELALLEARRAAREDALRDLLDRSISQSGASDLAGTFDSPAPGELLLLFHPQTSGWLSVAVTTDTVTAVAPPCSVNASVTDALARCLLEPHAARIATANRLLLIPHSTLRGVDFHALSVDGEALLTRMSVAYSLDAGDRSDMVLDARSALLVSDPTLQLPASRREADAVGDLLSQRRTLALRRLDGRAASFGALQGALAEAELLHFAGHADYRHEGTWDSALALANGGVLSVSDIVGLPQAPRYVVLSACDTARTSAQPGGDTVGLAQAFILRGTQVVLATARAVRDDEALRMMTLFYAYWRDGLDAPEALRHAQLAAQASDVANDWSAFRLLVR